jgi:hypothetical protein
LQKAANRESIPARLKHTLGDWNDELVLGLLLDPVGLMPKPGAGDLALIDGDSKSRDIEEEWRGAEAQNHLAARIELNMLGQAEGKLPLGQNSLEPAIAGLQEWEIKCALAPTRFERSGVDGEHGESDRRSDREDSEFRVFNFHGWYFKKLPAARYGVIPLGTPPAGLGLGEAKWLVALHAFGRKEELKNLQASCAESAGATQ